MAVTGAVLLVSDLHLAPDTPEITARFLRFLDSTAPDAKRLIILGDLFDAWAGDDDISAPFNAHIISALRTLTNSGVALDFLPGNRDFLAGEAFATATGAHLLPDPCVVDIAGTRTLLTHGDMLCTDDADYQAWRQLARTPAWQTAFLSKPLTERKREIAALRMRSEQAKRDKPMSIMDVNAMAVTTAFVAQGVDALIHGHTHQQKRHLLTIGGQDRTRWVLGDWHAERGNALRCSPEGWGWLDA